MLFSAGNAKKNVFTVFIDPTVTIDGLKLMLPDLAAFVYLEDNCSIKGSIYILCRYEFEYFSFLIIAVLFSAGNAKKNVFTVFTVPIVTIDGFTF